jgi:hypothetical protein
VRNDSTTVENEGGLMDAVAIILLASMLCFIAVIVLLF